MRIPAHAVGAENPWLVCGPVHPAWRPPDVVEYRRRTGLGGNESYPDLFQPYGGFPDGVRVENGHITMPDLPGIGFEGKADLYAEMRRLSS
jgi:hypothetical protein